MPRVTIDEIVKILGDPVVNRIEFKADNFYVNPWGIRAVATKFSKNKVSVQYVDRSPAGQNGSQDVYFYTSSANSMTLPVPTDELQANFLQCMDSQVMPHLLSYDFNGALAEQTKCVMHLPNDRDTSGLRKEALILHECVHALADLKKISVVDYVNESCAYIAQCCYLLAKDPSLRNFNYDPQWSMFTVATKIAYKILNRRKWHIHSDELQEMKSALAGNSLYTSVVDRVDVGDGI